MLCLVLVLGISSTWYPYIRRHLDSYLARRTCTDQSYLSARVHKYIQLYKIYLLAFALRYVLFYSPIFGFSLISPYLALHTFSFGTRFQYVDQLNFKSQDTAPKKPLKRILRGKSGIGSHSAAFPLFGPLLSPLLILGPSPCPLIECVPYP